MDKGWPLTQFTVYSVIAHKMFLVKHNMLFSSIGLKSQSTQ